jgi:hypothetical protein
MADPTIPDSSAPITAGGDSGVKFTLSAPVTDHSVVRPPRKATQQEMSDYFVHGKPPSP